MGFWKTQPVGTRVELRREDAPTPLPDGYEWGTCSVDALRNLLVNYISDEKSHLDYRVDLLKRELHPDEHFNVALRHKGKLVGFIGAEPRVMRLRDESVRVVVINFLCLSQKHRSKALAPLLIREITRRAVARGIQQAVYTAAADLPGAVCSGMYWHRLLNPKKLTECGFYSTDRPKSRYHDIRGSSRARMRPAKDSDVSRIARMLRDHESTRELYMEDIDEEYVRSKIMPTHAFVSEEGDEDAFACLFELNNVGNDGRTIKQCIVRHVVGPSTLESLDVIAANLGYDLLTILDLGHDHEYLKSCRFLIGPQSLIHLYLYNLDTPDPALSRKNVSVVII